MRVAPKIYAMAIIDHLANRSSEALIQDIASSYTLQMDGYDERVELLDSGPIIDAALTLLRDSGTVDVSKTYLLPKAVKLKKDIGDIFEHLNFIFDDDEVIQDYLKFRGRGVWIITALENVAKEYIMLKIEDRDFDTQVIAEEWSPIPLDRSEPLQVDLETKLAEVVEQIRSSNGIAETEPGLHQFVLSKLRSALETIKTSRSVTKAYIKAFMVQPLVLLVKRYGSSAVGAAADLAKTALKEWLKKKGISFLDGL